MPDVPTALREIPPGPERQQWVPLLRLADEPGPLRQVIDDGTLFATEADGQPEAAILVTMPEPGVAELRAVAVAEAVQGRGVGSRVVAAVLDALAARGVRSVRVGTASSGVRQLAFYQRCGFRLTHVERDFFVPARGYPEGLEEGGVPTRDMVWMEQAIGPTD